MIFLMRNEMQKYTDNVIFFFACECLLCLGIFYLYFKKQHFIYFKVRNTETVVYLYLLTVFVP